jgi:hypothetical protein
MELALASGPLPARKNDHYLVKKVFPDIWHEW